jgi:hypothetical protein
VRRPTVAEAFVAPELALLPALLVLLDCSLVLLRAQYPQLERPAQHRDTRALRDARSLHVEIESARAALLRYLRTARRAVRDAIYADGEIPF